MDSMGAGADGIDDFEGGTIEAEEEVECLLSELWCEAVGVVAVGVGGSDSRSSDWELSFLACNESLSFFFFLRNPRVGMRKIAGNILRGEGSCWWPPPIPLSVSSRLLSLGRQIPEDLDKGLRESGDGSSGEYNSISM